VATTRDPSTDRARHLDHRRLVPPDRLAVAESGLLDASDLRAVREAGYAAALVGTAFLRGPRTVEEVVEELGQVFAPTAPRPGLTEP
jgi:indole-3-glycerol phosphate synthase